MFRSPPIRAHSDIVAKFTSLPSHGLKDPFPRSLRSATLDLASNNLICSVALTGVLALQAGRFWAEKADPDDEDAEPDSDGEDNKSGLSRGITPPPDIKQPS